MEPRRIAVLGVPMDLGQRRRGVDMGPSALRYGRLEDRLEELGHDVQDLGDVIVPAAEELGISHDGPGGGMGFLDEIRRACEATVEKLLALPAEVFPVVVSAEDVGRGKPSPAIFLEAARRLGVAPETCAVVEDSRPGLEAALRAFMRCIAVPYLTDEPLLHDVVKPPTFTPPDGPDGRIRFDEHVEVGTKMAEEICRRLRLSNDEIEQLSALVANHLRFKDVFRMKPSTLKRFVRLPKFEEEHLELHRLDCLASHGLLDSYEFVQNFLRETPPEQVRPPRLVTGEDLKTLGYRPGPQFAVILKAVEDAQLEGQLASHDQALAFVKENFPPT